MLSTCIQDLALFYYLNFRLPEIQIMDREPRTYLCYIMKQLIKLHIYKPVGFGRQTDRQADKQTDKVDKPTLIVKHKSEVYTANLANFFQKFIFVAQFCGDITLCV
jgi:hypothetical protein